MSSATTLGRITALLGASTMTVAWQLPRSNIPPEALGFSSLDGQHPLASVPPHDDDIDIVTGSQFHGLTTFSNLPYLNSFSEDETRNQDARYDIAILGAPFDTGTTGRPGARFGPRGIRTGSQRMFPGAASIYTGATPLQSWAKIIDTGDVRMTRLVNHGTFLHIAHEEGLIQNTSIHAGIRAPVIRPRADMRNDARCGFDIITARAIDKAGADGIVARIRERVRDANVYVSVDIDVLDPAYAPATGTAEPGGWTTRELLTILDGLSGLKVVGADVVEVAPAYDNPGETTVLAAAEVALSLLTLMVDQPVQSKDDQAALRVSA